MNISTGKSKDERGTHYKYLRSEVEFGLDIEIRQYPQNTFISYEDNRENPCSCVDIEECFLCPVIIWQKVPNWLFEQEIFQYIEAFIKHIELNGFDNSDKQISSSIISEWQRMK